MLEYQKPFETLPEVGGTFAEAPGFRVMPLAGTGFLLLQSASESSLQEALIGEIGLGLPAPRAASVRGDYALLWRSPAEWLLELPASEADRLQAALTRRLATSLAVVTDMTDALAYCEVSGERTAEILMSGCSLDLRADAFPPGRVARTALADVPATLWNPGGEPHRLRCIVDRSFARHLRDWLRDVPESQRPPSVA